MVNKNFLTLFFTLVFRICHGQLIYTGNQEYQNWITTNQDSSVLWENYNNRKKISTIDSHHFGVFLNYNSKSNLNIIQEKSDLIGNGFLTNYKYSLSGFEIFNSMFFTNNYLEAKRGFVRTIKGVTMYTNQAYLKYFKSLDNINYFFKVGRDFLIEGYGNDSRIFFSDFSRPFDQISLKVARKNIIGKFAVISLDTLGSHNRYLYMHTLGYKSKNIKITLGEAVISSGINEPVNIKLLNPINFWSWENIGTTDRGLNALLYLGFSYTQKPTLRFYGEIIVDDINFHQKKAYYLNKYGYLFGFQKTSFPFSSSNIWFEFSNILNQVYQSYHPSHIYNHMNYPIGHHLGNDFINMRFHYSQIIESRINRVFFDFSHLMQGSNSLQTPFMNPWEDYNGNFIDSYKHPGYPTPPINYINDISFGFELSLKGQSFLILSLESKIQDKKEFYLNTRIRFWSYLSIDK